MKDLNNIDREKVRHCDINILQKLNITVYSVFQFIAIPKAQSI